MHLTKSEILARLQELNSRAKNGSLLPEDSDQYLEKVIEEYSKKTTNEINAIGYAVIDSVALSNDIKQIDEEMSKIRRNNLKVLIDSK